MSATVLAAMPQGELKMLPPLYSFLVKTRRIGDGTLVAHELPWRGRRVDLATLTTSGSSTAYELKLGSVGRALEQAIYNTRSFNRSFIVVDREPTVSQLAMARHHGVGVIVVADAVRLAMPPRVNRPIPEVRRRLARQLRTPGSVRDV